MGLVGKLWCIRCVCVVLLCCVDVVVFLVDVGVGVLGLEIVYNKIDVSVVGMGWILEKGGGKGFKRKDGFGIGRNKEKMRRELWLVWGWLWFLFWYVVVLMVEYCLWGRDEEIGI